MKEPASSGVGDNADSITGLDVATLLTESLQHLLGRTLGWRQLFELAILGDEGAKSVEDRRQKGLPREHRRLLHLDLVAVKGDVLLHSIELGDRSTEADELIGVVRISPKILLGTFAKIEMFEDCDDSPNEPLIRVDLQTVGIRTILNLVFQCAPPKGTLFIIMSYLSISRQV